MHEHEVRELLIAYFDKSYADAICRFEILSAKSNSASLINDYYDVVLQKMHGYYLGVADLYYVFTYFSRSSFSAEFYPIYLEYKKKIETARIEYVTLSWNVV